MTIYLLIIVIGTGLIASIGGLFSNVLNLDIWYVALITPLLTISVMIIDALGAIIIRKLPNRWFDSKNKYFECGPLEKKLYEKLKIKKWKDKIPELGGFTNFHKDKVRDPKNPIYLERFILECNYGSTIHLVTGVLGFLVILITPIRIFYLLALPVAFVNLILNLLPFFVLRYNVSRLKILLTFSNRNNKKVAN